MTEFVKHIWRAAVARSDEAKTRKRGNCDALQLEAAPRQASRYPL